MLGGRFLWLGLGLGGGKKKELGLVARDIAMRDLRQMPDETAKLIDEIRSLSDTEATQLKGLVGQALESTYERIRAGG